VEGNTNKYTEFVIAAQIKLHANAMSIGPAAGNTSAVAYKLATVIIKQLKTNGKSPQRIRHVKSFKVSLSNLKLEAEIELVTFEIKY